jgi:hypothetical protein
MRLLGNLRVTLVDLNIEEGEAIISVRLEPEREEPRDAPGAAKAVLYWTNYSPEASAILHRWGI